MENKYNESTPNRPWGGRALDAKIVPIDLHAYTQELMDEKAWQTNDRNAITVFKTNKQTLVLVALHKDAEVKPGNFESDGIINLQVMDGRISFSAEKEELEINRGQMIVVHEHIPYSFRALEESICLLSFTK